MRTRPRATSRDLRLAIGCLPRRTREAMLEGIARNEIIVGAYATGDGICPMLAAHRHGGRTNFISFAHAWDRFAFRDGRGDRRAGTARRATDRELQVLRVHLEASLFDDDAPATDLAAARREHDALIRARERDQAATPSSTPTAPRRAPRSRPRPGDPDRRTERADRPGWSWSRLVRRYDDYERLLARLDAESTRTDDRPELDPGAGASEPVAAR